MEGEQWQEGRDSKRRREVTERGGCRWRGRKRGEWAGVSTVLCPPLTPGTALRTDRKLESLTHSSSKVPPPTHFILNHGTILWNTGPLHTWTLSNCHAVTVEQSLNTE